MFVEDATFNMPPHPNWFRGRDAVITFMRAWAGRRFASSRAVPMVSLSSAGTAWTSGGGVSSQLPEELTLEGDRVKDIIALAMPESFGRFRLPGEVNVRDP